MPFMIGIGESADALLTIAPIILITFSGYTTGVIVSKAFPNKASRFARDLIYGNLVLNFLFISGFIVFGDLTNEANEYFTVFTYLLVGISIVGIYLLMEKLIRSILHGVGVEYVKGKIRNFKLLLISSGHDGQVNIFIIFGIALLVTVLVYQALIIFFHPIYSEYDSIYLFLPISKSILLGNGLNHDFYLGSDVNMRFPPFVQAINAWLIHSFEYSSIRMFPFYYVFFTAFLVFYLTRSILNKTSNKGDASFFGLIASSAFLITPAILVTSSRFSLQEDLAFIFFLTASFYFLFEINRYDKPAKMKTLMLSTSLALMILTREVGLVMSIAIFFLVPAIKYTEGNLKLRFLFTVLSLLPFYIYYIKNYLFNSGLVVIVLANLAIFYILTKLKNQNKFSSLIRSPSNLKYIVPLAIPVIFIATNIVLFNGLYPNISFSDKFYETISLQIDAFTNQSGKPQELLDTIEGIPRIDILFISIAMGGIFIFFKFVGLGKIIYKLKNNYQYCIILILMIFLLITWSSVLQSGFKTSDIRHLAYFGPLLSIILVIGLKKNEESPFYWKLFCYLVIVFSTHYFLTFNLHSLNHENNFAGFAIDPFRDPIITSIDLGLAIILVLPLLIVGLMELKRPSKTKKEFKLQKYQVPFTITFLIALLAIQIYTISLSQINFTPLKLDKQSPPGWETNVFEVINYLNSSENGNVLAMRAPGIPFFTNRTSFDLFNQQAFASDISDLILIKNSTVLKHRLSEMGIEYIVIPNERSSLYYAVQNLIKNSQFVQTINTDDDFEKIVFKNFDLYKYSPEPVTRIDLIDKNHIWKPFGKTEVNQNKNNLSIRVDTNEKGKIYNRAYLQTKLNLANKPVLLSLSYNVETRIGNATYHLEIRDNNSRILFESLLNNLSGNSTHQTLILPKDIGGDNPYEFRIYAITQGPGYHALNVKKFSISYA